MATRLFESARTGNVDDLNNLLGENPLILHTISLYSGENPLHVASAAGHIGYVREILSLRPEYAKEVNKEGFSPLHIAAANGYIEVVRELLNVDRKLCCLEGRENKTPLHFAATKGRVDVIGEMLSSCAECIQGVTVQRETALHLAVKNSQFEAVKVTVQWILEMKKEDIFNFKDEQGNTILHLATWKKQRQVIELILGIGTASSGSLEVNAVNECGLTALDVLQMFSSEAGDREIAEMLQRAGAVRARDLTISPFPPFESCNQVTNQTGPRPRCHQIPRQNLVEYFKFEKGRDSPSEARSTLLVIAVLVATATFQVGLNPPGGTWQESHNIDSPNQNNGTTRLGVAGKSIMGTYNGIAFALFVVFNSLGFSMSLFMINILTSKFPLQLELQICIVALFFTYDVAMSSIAPRSLSTFTTVVTLVFSTLTPLLTKLVKRLVKLLKELVMDIIQNNSTLQMMCKVLRILCSDV